eukprot:gene4636-5507_t
MVDTTNIQNKWSLRIFIAEILSKRWMETLIPWVVFVVVAAITIALIPGYLEAENLEATLRQFGEFAFVGLAMGIVLIGGSVDLSVGAIFALIN